MAPKTTKPEELASRLKARYDALRGLALIAQKLQKALFTRRPDDVLFWALVNAHFCSADTCEELRIQVEEAIKAYGGTDLDFE